MTLKQITKASPGHMARVLREVPDNTDFVIIDAPGGLRRETIAALRAAREVLLVTTPDMISISDCMKARLIAEFLGLTPLGVILNRVRGDEFEIKSGEIKTIMNLPVLAEIPEDLIVEEALNKGEPLMVLDPKSPAAKEIMKLAKRLIKTKAQKA
jgi:septum site-determining protein MinD